jgi:hypothetical protein
VESASEAKRLERQVLGRNALQSGRGDSNS